MKLGDRIRSMREFRKMTQGELVKGISSIAYISKVENNKTKPTEQFLKKISLRLMVDPLVLQQSNVEGFEEQLERIYRSYWTKDTITDEEITLLRFQCDEEHTNRVNLMMYSILIRYYYLKSDLKEAKRLYTLSNYLIFEEDPSISHDLYFYYFFSCGVLYYELQDLIQANQYYFKAHMYASNMGERNKARLYYNMSLVNQKINPDKTICLHYSSRAYDLMKGSGETVRILPILLVRSIQLFQMNKRAEALNCLREAEALHYQEERAAVSASIHYLYGRTYYLSEDKPRAIQSLLKSISLFHELGMLDKCIPPYKRLVEIYFECGDWLNAARYLERALEISSTLEDVFSDIELNMLELQLIKSKGKDKLYEKEAIKLIAYCMKQRQYVFGKQLSAELGAYYHNKMMYKKASYYFNQAYLADQGLHNPNHSI